jgi:hypothetical protein
MTVPFKITFDSAKLYAHYADVVLYISTILLVTAFIIKSINPNLEPISNIINGINCLFIVAYTVLKFITDYLFYGASTQKRFDFIDNSFKTSFSEDNSIEYYSNEDIEKGIYKLAVNGFENSFFTYNIAKLMLKPIWIKNTIIAIAFISLAIMGYNNVFIMLLQLTLPLLLLSKAIKLTLFVNRINRVYENYRKLFQYLKNNNEKDNKRPEIIINVIEYETTLSWGSVLLDTKIYNSLNSELSKKWEEIKGKYKIK